METTVAVGILGLLMSFLAFWAAWYILILVSRWKMFEKAGISGWKSLIPIYSDYMTYKISWKTTFFWIWLAAGFVSAMVSGMASGYTDSGEAVPVFISLISSAAGLAVMIIQLLQNIYLSKRFGHGALFGLGLTFFTPIFTMIIGLGSSVYEGNPEENLPPQMAY